MPRTGVIERSVIQLNGEKKRVKLISRKDGDGGYVYDVTVNNNVEYKNIKRKQDANQLYRQAKKDATEDLKNGNDSGSGGFLGGGGGLFASGMEGTDTDSSSPSLPKMGMDPDNDGEEGPMLPGFGGGEQSDREPQFPGFGSMDGNEGGTGPTLPGFGMGMEQEDTDADDEDEPKPFGFKY